MIRAAHAAGRKIGICGQAPSDYPEFAQFLVTRASTASRSIPTPSSRRCSRSSMRKRRWERVPPKAELEAERPNAGISRITCHGGDKRIEPEDVVSLTPDASVVRTASGHPGPQVGHT